LTVTQASASGIPLMMTADDEWILLMIISVGVFPLAAFPLEPLQLFRWRRNLVFPLETSIHHHRLGRAAAPRFEREVLNRVFVRSKMKVFHDSYLHS